MRILRVLFIWMVADAAMRDRLSFIRKAHQAAKRAARARAYDGNPLKAVGLLLAMLVAVVFMGKACGLPAHTQQWKEQQIMNAMNHAAASWNQRQALDGLNRAAQTLCDYVPRGDVVQAFPPESNQLLLTLRDVKLVCPAGPWDQDMRVTFLNGTQEQFTGMQWWVHP